MGGRHGLITALMIMALLGAGETVDADGKAERGRKGCRASLSAVHGQVPTRGNAKPLRSQGFEELDRAKIITQYARLARKLGTLPTLTALARATHVELARIEELFPDLSELKRLAIKENPKAFDRVVDTTRFSSERFAAMLSRLREYDRFLITTAVGGGPVHEGFYQALKNFQDRMKAALVIKPGGMNFELIDERLTSEEFFAFDETILTATTYIENLLISEKMINPFTGARRLASGRNLILASPKQDLEYIPVRDPRNPRALMTTGAITLPSYQGEHPIQFRTDELANRDHVVGALIMERGANGQDYFFQIQAREDGSFVHLGVRYLPDGSVESVNPAAIVVGDWHSGETAPAAVEGLKSFCSTLRPGLLVLHDIFDGRSINHHDRDKAITRARRAGLGQLSLEAELKGVAEDLKMLIQLTDRIAIAESNHDVRLRKWIETGEFVKDAFNLKLTLELASAMLNGENPLSYGVKKFWTGTEEEWSRIRWLKRDEDLTVAGIQLSYHGDRGANGRLPSQASFEEGLRSYIVGHSHSPKIKRQGWVVGTSTHLRLEYTDGLSSWAHANAVVYPDGSRQMIVIASDSSWRLEE